MILYNNTYSNDPCFNLALEEYLLRSCGEDTAMLWQNSPSVIIGANQDLQSEVNESYAKENNIPIIRRITGGGAVYHDLGNLNYSLIYADGAAHFGDYSRCTKWIMDALSELGIETYTTGNDIQISETSGTAGKKISGNAQYAWHGRLLHHGTLLLHTDLSILDEVLRRDESKMRRKGIKSVSARVVNLDVALDELIAVLKKGFTEIPLTPELINAANELANIKYRNRNWNYEGIDYD